MRRREAAGTVSARPEGPEQPRPPLHHRPRLWLAGALTLVGVAALGTMADYWLRVRAVPPPVVFLEPVTRGPVVAQLRLTGTLRPAESRAVTQPSAGRATEVMVRVGSPVAVGQVVMRFDPLAQRVEVARIESRLE